MTTAAYAAALLIGLSLGLIGGGGSILTVPILVYLFGVAPVLATSYSLFIVGITSLVGAVNSFINKKVDIKTVLIFGTLSVVTVLKITGIAVAGVLAGAAIGKKTGGNVLKKGFGWFVLLMGIYIIIHELMHIGNH
ncbi:MAG: TSUP family transporter [Niabella sp.]